MARISHRLAVEPQIAHDEDTSFDEHEHDRPPTIGDDDEGEECDALDQLFLGLRAGDVKTAHITMALIHILQKMLSAAGRENDRELEHWHRQGRRLFDTAYAVNEEED